LIALSGDTSHKPELGLSVVAAKELWDAEVDPVLAVEIVGDQIFSLF
jgi:hypothetical protein